MSASNIKYGKFSKVGIKFQDRNYLVLAANIHRTRDQVPMYDLGVADPLSYRSGPTHTRVEVEMPDDSLCNSIEDWQGGLLGDIRMAEVDVIIRNSNDKFIIKKASVAEYFKTKVTLIGGILTHDTNVIEVNNFVALERAEILEKIERKNPSLKRFRTLLDLED